MPLFLSKSFWLMKNITPRQLAMLVSFWLFIVLFLVFCILNFFVLPPLALHIILYYSLVSSILAYIFFFLALQKFIYRRIKLIYKIIRTTKNESSAHSESQVDMNQNIIDDVTAEVRAWGREKKQEIEELKALEKYRREFLGNVSHELKTPINNMQGYLHTLIDSDLQDEKINMSYLQKTANNLERLKIIVDDLLTINKHESGVFELQPAPFKIYDLIAEVFLNLEMKAKHHQVALEYKEGCDKGMKVHADRERIQQVFSNLITNAIHYSRKQNAKVLIGWYTIENEVLIEVTDNGIGILEQHLPRIFERFYRVESSRSRDSGGSGLGLAIVKHIIEAHNQTIHVRSTVGVGTTFGFSLPKMP